MCASENEDLLFCNKYKYQLSNGFLVTNESYNNIYEWDKVINIINALVNKKLNLSNGCLYICWDTRSLSNEFLKCSCIHICKNKHNKRYIKLYKNPKKILSLFSNLYKIDNSYFNVRKDYNNHNDLHISFEYINKILREASNEEIEEVFSVSNFLDKIVANFPVITITYNNNYFYIFYITTKNKIENEICKNMDDTLKYLNINLELKSRHNKLLIYNSVYDIKTVNALVKIHNIKTY